jgi:aminoglycoside phosphotransferase (APT) family kinase protein
VFGDAEAASHLLRRGLIPAAGSPSSVTLRRLPGRNLVYRIEFDGAATLLLKRAVDPVTRRGLDREARAYELIAECGDPSPFAVPRKLDYDPRSSTLVLEYLSRHRPLNVPDGVRELNPTLAHTLGCMLARLHAISAPAGDSTPPWILSLIHPPVGILRESSREQLELIGHVQGSATWRSALEDLTEDWRPRSLVHGDLRFSNILLGSPPRSSEPALALIDWELAGCGDPGWDTGWVIAEILGGRLRNLSEAFPLLRAFWTGYVDEAGTADSHPRLEGALRWSAAASLQMAHEAAAWPPEGEAHIAKLLEVGRSLLERPTVWVERVFTPTDR